MAGIHIHLDAVGGVAGDMVAAALLDAFPDLTERVMAEVTAVLPSGVGAPTVTAGASGGLRALRFGLADRGHAHHHHDHGDSHSHHDDAGTFVMMRGLIAAAVPARAATHAIAILTVLAEAESAIHGVPVEAVHFHEIADWDSLMDVVAAGSLIAALEERYGSVTWSVSDLPLGGGAVRTRHGLLPVPAPATAMILAGFRWRDDGIAGERVTPTGAAILCHLRPVAERSAGRLLATGSGAGTRNLPGLPNILRALVMETDGAPASGDEVAVVTFDVDDMTGEEIAAAADRLRAEDGVLDLALFPGLGKKGRPVQEVRLLVRPDALDRVADRCLTETATIGLRWRLERRRILPRTATAVQVDGAPVRLKTVERPGGTTTRKAESDDLSALPLAERRRRQRAAEQKGDDDER